MLKRENAPEIPLPTIRNVRRVIIEESSGSKTAHEFSDSGQAMQFAREAAGWPRLELLQIQLRDDD
jgi:hypothetical protein